MELAGYLASVLVGITLGLLGGGGSILTIPILVYLFQLDVITATAYSLFMVGATSLVGVVSKYRNGTVHFQSVFLFGIPSLIAVFITRIWIVPSLPEVLLEAPFTINKRLFLLGLFSVLMMVTAISMLMKKPGHAVTSPGQLRLPAMSSLGLVVGFITGLVGAGGGFLIVPALVMFARLPLPVAAGTSLFIIGINSSIGFVGDVLHSAIQWPFLLMLTTLAIAGVLMGNMMATRISNQRLRQLFGWFILIMGCWILLREIEPGWLMISR